MFAVIGEALLDMVETPDGSAYTAIPGGSPQNVAVGLRRLGHPTAMMARYSTTELGRRVRRYAEHNDLDLSASVTTDQPPTLAFASFDDDNNASYDFYLDGTADWAWSRDELRLPPDTGIVHGGSMAAMLDPGAQSIAAWWTTLAEQNRPLLSFDPNVRPGLLDRAETCPRVEHMVAHSHVVKASDDDLAWLYPEVPPAHSARRWADSGPGLVVLTSGGEGCLAFFGAASPVGVRASAVEVVDTIGAGDAFASGLLSGLADAGVTTPEAVQGLPASVIESVLQRATLTAALTCQRAGADPPTRAEYDAAAARLPGR